MKLQHLGDIFNASASFPSLIRSQGHKPLELKAGFKIQLSSHLLLLLSKLGYPGSPTYNKIAWSILWMTGTDGKPYQDLFLRNPHSLVRVLIQSKDYFSSLLTALHIERAAMCLLIRFYLFPGINIPIFHITWFPDFSSSWVPIVFETFI